MFHTRIDILMIGCLAAFLLDSPAWRERIARIPVWPVLSASSLFLLGIEPYLQTHFVGNRLTRGAISAGVPTVEAVAIAATILVLVAGKRGKAQALLNQPALVHVGQLSYSLYLWQQLFLAPSAASNLLSLAERVGATYLVALGSFRFLEQPILKMRKKFRRVAE